MGKRGSHDYAMLSRGKLVVGLPLTITVSYPILPLLRFYRMQPPPTPSLPTKCGLENEDAINPVHL